MWKDVTCQLRIQKGGLRRGINALDGETKGAECLLNTKELIQSQTSTGPVTNFSILNMGSSPGWKVYEARCNCSRLKVSIESLRYLHNVCGPLELEKASWPHLFEQLREKRMNEWGNRGQFCSRRGGILCLLLSYWSDPITTSFCTQQEMMKAGLQIYETSRSDKALETKRRK